MTKPSAEAASAPQRHNRRRAIIVSLAGMVIVAGLASLVFFRLTRPGEPEFIREMEPHDTHRVLSLHYGGGYFARPTIFLVFYGSERPFKETLEHYRTELTAHGFTLREQHTPLDPEDPIQFERRGDEHGNECVELDSVKTEDRIREIAADLDRYAFAYSLGYQRDRGS